MNVNIEFFDRDPIENLITCLNFKMDKVVYFGYSDLMTKERQDNTRRILKKLCDIDQVEFHVVSQRNLYSVVERLTQTLQQEQQAKNKCFFDLTGGEELPAVAMGILCREFATPMHLYDVVTQRLHMLNKREMPGIEEVVERRSIQLTLDDIIGFRGGRICYRHQKMSKSNLDNEEFKGLVDAMWEIAKDAQEKWNAVSAVFKECTKYERDTLHVSIGLGKLKELVAKRRDLASIHEFIQYLERMQQGGILTRLQVAGDMVSYRYPSEEMRECLLDAGCLLELRTYYDRKASGKYSDCRVGVHIDWDGVFKGDGQDVENEIDVMLLEGHTPVFISCKNGKVDQMALYELHTVAMRFGGRYVKKELVAGQGVSQGYLLRAEELGIVVNKEEGNEA